MADLFKQKSQASVDQERKKLKISRNITIGLVIIAIILYLFVPGLKEKVNEATRVLSSLDINPVVEYIRSYGKLAAAISFLLMIMQSVAAPIPAFLITLSNAAIFGWVKGAILSWSSAMAGAALCFFIARGLGRGAVEKLTSKGSLENIDLFFKKYGKHTILICRLLPFVSFDVVSYAAGLTSMGFWEFFLATGLGQLPATIVYSYVGGVLTGGAQKLFIGLVSLFAISILIAMIKKIYDDKQKMK